VLLAAIWSVPLLAGAGIAQTALFHQDAVSRFDDDLFDVVNGLYAGSTVDDQGVVDAPPLTDSRATRAYSGKYWEISEPAGDKLHVLTPSRSLWDSELNGPDGGPAALKAAAGKPIFYDTMGPAHQPLRAVAMLTTLPGRAAPVIFMAAENRSELDADANRFAFETAIFLLVLGVGLILPILIQVRVGLQPLFALRREIARRCGCTATIRPS
jgi:CheY-like chemotaxis protein